MVQYHACEMSSPTRFPYSWQPDHDLRGMYLFPGKLFSPKHSSLWNQEPAKKEIPKDIDLRDDLPLGEKNHPTGKLTN